MPTPLTPDEEFDAHFRRGLEHYPDLPDAPDAWLRMETLLDAEPPAPPPALRWQVLRLLGAGVILVVLLAGLGWHYQHILRRWAASHAQPALPGGQAATGTPALHRNAVGQAPSTAGAAHSVRPKQGGLSIGNSQSTRNFTKLPEPPTTTRTLGAGVSTADVSTVAAAAYAPASRRGAGRTDAGNSSPAASTREPASPGSDHPATGWAAGSRARRHWQAGSQYDVASTASSGLTNAASLSTSRERARHRAKIGAAPLAASSLPANALPGNARRAKAASHPPVGITLAGPGRRRPRHAYTARTAEKTPAAVANYHPAARQGTAKAQLDAVNELMGRPLAGADERPLAIDTLAGTGQLRLWPDAQPPLVLHLARVTPFDSLPAPKPLVAASYRLQLGLLASPELNTVHRSSAGLGGSVGIQVEYRLARRWRLSTGYLQAIKRYEAAGSDYQLAAQWPGSWVLSDVTANCRIIDVPLNLRFDVWQQPQRRAFVSGGLSSLFMRREDYRYTYDAGGKTYSAAWQFLNNSNHPFQVLNLSAGYEQNLNSRWALQVEPYFKLPLGGIGYGAVRLQSAGVFFSLKYGLLRAAPGR